MYNIKSLYTDYGEIIATFGEDKIESRITYFLDAINSFISAFNSEDITALEVNDKVLQFCIMDYFSDIYRLKEFHKIGKINDIKRVAYESYWILRRKPIQILSDDDSDDKIVFANEKLLSSDFNNMLSLECVNSIKSRVKNPYHLIDKIVRKILTDTNYKELGLDNYHLYFDDLLGFRLIMLYHEDWLDLHKAIVNIYNCDENDFTDKKNRFKLNNNAKPFIISVPEINIRNGDDDSIYKSKFSSLNGCYPIIKSGRYYRSIHYSVFHSGYCFESRSVVSNTIMDEISAKVSDYGIVIDEFNITNFSFSKAFDDAIEQKLVAEQNKIKAATENEQRVAAAEADAAEAKARAEGEAEAAKIKAQGEAEAIKAKADAEAEANKKINDSITQTLIDYNRIQNWDGKLPNVMTGSDGNVIVNATE